MPLAFGILLLVLALVKVTSYWQNLGFRGSQLFLVLIKDQILYFALSAATFLKYIITVLTVCRAISVAAFSIAENQTTSSIALTSILNALGSSTLLCVIGSRMFFNLQEAAEHGVNPGTNWSSHSDTVIRFGEPMSGNVQ